MFANPRGTLRLKATAVEMPTRASQPHSPARVLILAKEKAIQHCCCHAAQVAGLQFVVFKNISAAYSALGSGQFGIVVLYLRWPADQGMDILEHIKFQHPKVAVIVLAGYGTVQSAVYAMKLGAYDFLITPLQPEELTLALAGAVQNNRVMAQQQFDDVAPTALTLEQSRDDAEKTVIFTALQAVRGNKDRAARLLGIGRTTLYQKLKKIANSNRADAPSDSGAPNHV